MSKLFTKPSPCVGTCLIDEETELCLGCNRTIDEIALWGDLTPSEAVLMMEVVHTRTLLLWDDWEAREDPTIQ